MNTIKRLRELEIERSVEINGMITLEEAEIEATRMYPEKRRAKRRVDTLAKNRRLRKMRTTVYGWEEGWYKNAKKDLAVSRWYSFADDYDFTRKEPDFIAEGVAEYAHLQKVEEFYKLVDQWQKQKS